MDPERPFRTTSSSSSGTATGSSELFICFTSRLSSSSSSSMKISSKSILSPGRAREPSQISLSTSLSRRLKTSGSLKGGQASPMFPTGGKKRGCAFDNPEPSSPKVTCIGQVRVKTKKQGKKMRARSQKRRSNSEASFRKPEQVQVQSNGNDQQFVAKQSHHLHQNSNNGGNGFQIQNSQPDCLSHRNQKWVHLPFTICEAVRAFGAELNCFLPCHSSCTTTNDRDKESKPERSSESESSCGTVFARWLVAVQDGDGKGREIELVVGDDETRTEKENGSQRRHVFEGLDFKEKNEVEEEESRISICIPPKNALLLMRCRSDPVKMAELAKRFCESPAPKVDEEDEEEDEDKTVDTQKEAKLELPVNKEEKEEEEDKTVEVNVEVKDDEELNEESTPDGEEEREQVLVEDEVNLVSQEEDDGQENREMGTEPEINEQQVDITVNQNQEEEEDEESNHNQRELAEETISIPTSCEPEVAPDAEQLESAKEEEECQLLPGLVSEEDDEKQGKEGSEEEGDSDNGEEDNPLSSKPTSDSLSVFTEQEANKAEIEADENFAENTSGSAERKETREEMCREDEEKATHEGIEPECSDIQNDEIGPDQSKERETPPPEAERESSVLPDCLLLMMYEPKLSMEVSKETWVCSTDFIRCVPTREKKTQNEKTNGREAPKKRVSIDCKPSENPPPQPILQPPRWSCSFPAPAAIGTGVSMATMIEQKLVSAKAYEPFVLTRCKSEPMRSSAKLAPDACFWKDRKLEPHRPATFGVGAAGVGF